MRELQQYLQSIAYLPFSHNLNNKGKNTMEKKKSTQEMSNLDPNLHFGSLDHELSFKPFVFASEPIGFPPK